MCRRWLTGPAMGFSGTGPSRVQQQGLCGVRGWPMLALSPWGLLFQCQWLRGVSGTPPWGPYTPLSPSCLVVAVS